MSEEDRMQTIEEEIKNVSLLCEQIEDIVTQPKKSVELNTKSLNTPQANPKSTEKKVTFKKNKRSKNMSMDFENIKPKDQTSSPSMKSSRSNKPNTNRSVDHDSTKTEKNSNKTPTPKTNNIKSSNNINNRSKTEGKNKKDLEDTKKPRTLLSAKPLPNVEDMLNRFKEQQIEKNNKMQELKKKFQMVEDGTIKKVPQINDKSKKMGGTSDDFLTRVTKFKETSDQKKKELAEKEEAKRLETENKIIEERNKKYKNKKLDKNQIDDKINTMYEWETNRKTKITKLKDSELQREKEECTFKPGIDKNSNKIANTKKNFMESDEIVERLYKQDVIKRKHKQEILEDIYAPSFNPTVNSSFKNVNLFTESNANYLTDRGNKTNGLNVQYITNKDSNMIGEILKERVKLIRNKHIDS